METSYCFLIGLIIYVGVVIYKANKYNSFLYHKDTKIPFWFMDKGQRGEYSIFRGLESLQKCGARFLFNLYVPTVYGNTTEIDMVMISLNGIYVIESKNYTGWIFGHEKQEQWTVVYKGGRKERLANPIKQNRWHINCLRNVLNADFPIYSVIVFSDSCTLKKLTVFDQRIVLGYRGETVRRILNMHNDENRHNITEQNVIDIYNQLCKFTQVDDAVKKQHVENIKHIHIAD